MTQNTILLVERPGAEPGMSQALERLGYRVVTAETGALAAPLLAAPSGIDLVLLDLDCCPGMPDNLPVPLVFLTALAAGDVSGKTAGLRGSGFLVRGANDALVEAVLRLAVQQFGAIHKSEQRETQFRTLFQTLHAINTLYDVVYDAGGRPCDYRYREVSPGFETLVGIPAPQLVGKTLLEVFPATEPYWLENLALAVQTGRPVTFENFSRELDSYTELNVYSPDRKTLFMSSSDITLRRRAEVALQARNAEYEVLNSQLEEKVRVRSEQLAQSAAALMQAEKYASLGRISARFSHLINTPLGVAVTSTSYLGELLRTLEEQARSQSLDTDDLPRFFSEAGGSLGLTASNLEKVDSILSKFRLFSAIGDRETAVPVRMDTFFDDLFQEFRFQYPDKVLDFRLEETASEPVLVYPVMMRRIVEELVENAVEHGLAGRPSGTIRVSFQSGAERWFRLRIHNDGATIPEALMPHLLEPFSGRDFSTSQSSLGMATIHALLVERTVLEHFRMTNADGVLVDIGARFR